MRLLRPAAAHRAAREPVAALRARAGLLPVLLGAALVVGTGLTLGGSAAAASSVLHVAPGGHGDCSAAAPCGSFDEAVARAGDGTTVQVAGGSYGLQKVRARPGTDALRTNVRIAPQDGQTVSVAGVEIFARHVTVAGVRSTGVVYVHQDADASGFDAVSTEGASAYVAGADDAFITRSRIRPAPDHDGLQIKNWKADDPNRVLIAGNTIGPVVRHTIGHLDCIQIMGGTSIHVQGNILYHCASQGMMVSSIGGGTVGPDLRITGNLIEQCLVRTADCDGFNAVNLGAHGAHVTGNTILDGALTVGSADNEVARNIVDNLKGCPDGLRPTDNLYAHTSCAGLDPSNHEGAARFVDRTAQPPTGTLLPGSPGTGWGFQGLWTGGGTAPAAPEPTGTPTPTPTPTPTAAPTPSPTPTPSPAPTPSPTPTSDPTAPPADPTGSPDPGPSAGEADVAVRWTGQVNSKVRERTGTWTLTRPTTMSFTVTHERFVGVARSDLVVTLVDGTGRLVAYGSGESPVTVTGPVPAGSYSLTITGRPGRFVAVGRAL